MSNRNQLAYLMLYTGPRRAYVGLVFARHKLRSRENTIFIRKSCALLGINKCLGANMVSCLWQTSVVL